MCIGMCEGVRLGRRRLRWFDFLADCQFQQRFLRFLREVRDDVEQRVLGRLTHVVDPVFRHAERHQLVFAQIIE